VFQWILATRCCARLGQPDGVGERGRSGQPDRVREPDGCGKPERFSEPERFDEPDSSGQQCVGRQV
jgi:hypothetical protein